jgi:hypothetical protein
MRFRKRPVLIDALQWDGTYSGWIRIVAAFPDIKVGSCNYNPVLDTVHLLFIRTLEGSHEVSENDWIVRGVKGEYYPCKPDIFAMTYEPVPQEDSGAVPNSRQQGQGCHGEAPQHP